MIKITFEFTDYVEAGKAIALLSGGAVKATDAPKPPAKAAAAGQAVAAKPAAAAAPAASSPEPTASAEVTPEQLTKAIVAAVTRAGRDKVVAHLKDEYGVAKGAEITDSEIRATCLASVSAL